jgi:hypothetical protein
MEDTVALIIGVSFYPDLASNWNVRQNRTANDAVEVTAALVKRGVDPRKIKLFLTPQGRLPKSVAGVVPQLAEKNKVEDFITKELVRPPYSSGRFFFFCSGHGVAAKGRQDTHLILSDSDIVDKKHVFRSLAIERLRIQLQGMGGLSEQLFCINSCRTPQEWAMTGEYNHLEVQPLTRGHYTTPVSQSAFFAAKELTKAPVQDLASGHSNGFAAAIVDCINSAAWPPDPDEWNARLKTAWPPTVPSGLPGSNSQLFKRLEIARYDLDRDEQSKLAEKKLDDATRWALRSTEPDLWRSTVIDLHACDTDCLDFLVQRLSNTVFKEAIGRVRRVTDWPSREDPIDLRQHAIRSYLSYCLIDDPDQINPATVVQRLLNSPKGPRVAYVQIKGPCHQNSDPALIASMLGFWKEIIGLAAEKRLAILPLLLIGHVDPEPTGERTSLIDTTTFYRSMRLPDADVRRLSKVKGHEVEQWLEVIIPKTHPQRADVERQIARALDVKFIQKIDARMERIFDAVGSLAAAV